MYNGIYSVSDTVVIPCTHVYCDLKLGGYQTHLVTQLLQYFSFVPALLVHKV